MLREAGLENFKSWRGPTRISCAPITGLFGSNSSGKTSILQWLLMLKQTAESADRRQVLNFGDERSLVDLGSFRDTVSGHDTALALSWSLRWTLPRALDVTDPARSKEATLFRGEEMGFSCRVLQDGAGLISVANMSYEFAGHRFLYSLGDKGYELAVEGSGPFRFKRIQGRPWPLPGPVKFYGFPDQTNNYFQNTGFLGDFQLAFEQFLAGVHYLGPLREYPKRQYIWSGAAPTDMGRRGEKAVDALLASRGRKEKISRGKGIRRLTVEEYVAHWLRELGLIHSFTVKPVAKGSNLYQVLVQKTKDASPVAITDVGFGVSQILPVLALCYYVPAGSTIVLEQPEIHLHPSVQAGLADVFVDAVKHRGIQVFLESHSEHLLRRFQRRIAEQQVRSDEVAFYFCDVVGGRSTLLPLEVDPVGNITNWPQDFFGDEFGEIAAMQQAALDRRHEMPR